MKHVKVFDLLTLILLIFSTQAYSSTVAIIDSGTDMKHEKIVDQAWINPLEIPDNLRDEDGNGYQDDVYGWNFAEQNNQVIDYKYLGLLNDRIRKFFNYQSKMLQGNASSEEIAWMREQIQDQKFLKKLQVYGNFMHGTHVAGIAAKSSVDAKILAVKLIPTEVKLPGQELQKNLAEKGLGMKLLKKGLEMLASQQMVLLEEIAFYVNDHKADIANGSFGTGYAQAEMIVQVLYKTLLRKDPTPEETKELALHFLNTLLKEGQKMLKAAPKTLFVFAAGNDGADNDKYPTSPAGIKGDNVITVAATLGRKSLAVFSNFGARSVEVAAPGVAINSSVPGNKYLEVSGTSQAAPFVANVASLVKDANPTLSAKQIKKILMGTVDIKDYLKDQVSTSGVVNSSRAIRAAELSKDKEIAAAIAQSRVDILDQEEDKGNIELISHPEAGQFVMPLPSAFKL